ncbi:probable fucosyltransferase 8 [Phragmites australis]|uniref:probable fucosyltransferase 8 n=1 Tax=Phragmites australis TaxID=29695 RepID=UPI002D7774BA|nr:probable fucosyltransferase 8 [Phragmites australis]
MYRGDEQLNMGSAGGKKRLYDPAEEACPTRAGVPRREEEERFGRTGAVLVVCLMTLPFFVFFFGGRENAAAVWQSAASKLAAMNGGFTNASHARSRGAATKADELFGGLLAPGLDRRACLSRYQSPQYYRHSPYAPSSRLLHKLRAYEARHKKCGPGTPLYAKSIEQLRSGHGTEVMECNYLVWLPYNGIGNRMLSLLSTFLYALLTGRVLLVYSTDDFTDLFCEPFPDATWVLPPDFPVANLSQLGWSTDQSYKNLLGQKKIVSDPEKATVLTVPPYVYVNLAHDPRFTDTMFYCNDDQLVLAKVNWLLLYSDLYFVPSLYSITEFQDELQWLFPAKESVSHLLTRYLFHPTNSVWGLVTRYYHTYLAQAEERIGMQIRMFSWASIPVDDMYNQILACSRREHILPDIDGDEAGDTASLAKTNGVDAAAGLKAVLIASLHADYYDRIRSAYYEHAAKGGVRVGVFQPSHEERQKTGKRTHNQKALAEIYLLSFSDVLLTTGRSTFGYVSSSLAGLRPAILHTPYNHKVPEMPCVRAISMEPCLHALPRVNCQRKAANKMDLARHVKACEDVGGGVKMFD